MVDTTIETLQKQKYLTLQTLKDSTVWNTVEVYHTALGIDNPRQLLFHASNKLLVLPHCICNVPLTWNADRRRYRSFCSRACTARGTRDQAKATMIDRYGVDHYSKTKEYRDQVQLTSRTKYGVNHYSKTGEFLMRITDTNTKNLGVPFASQSDTVKEKTKNYFIAQYGVDNPMKLPETTEF